MTSLLGKSSRGKNYLEQIQITSFGAIMKQHFEATLADVKPGYTAIISGFNEDQIPLKMLEMGLLPGNVVLVKRYSPFGDPMHIRVAGFDMALRLDEAAYVHVDAATITPEKAA